MPQFRRLDEPDVCLSTDILETAATKKANAHHLIDHGLLQHRMGSIAGPAALGTRQPTKMRPCSWVSLLLCIACSAFQSTYRLQRIASSTAAPFSESRTQRRQRLAAATTLLPPPSPSVSQTSDDRLKVGILMLNLGGPETTSDVEGFLYNLFNDPDIIRLPPYLSLLQPFIATIISKRRAPKSRAAYKSIGGGSPILQYSHAQGRLICERLRELHADWLDARYYLAMRYWHPLTEDALEEAIRRDGIQALVVVPLYPQFSISTTGSSLRVLQREFSTKYFVNADSADASGSAGTMPVHTVISNWHLRPGYLRSMARLIQRELDAFAPDQLQEARAAAPDLPTRHVLFSAHGVPLSYIEAAGDPYQEQIEECVRALTELLPDQNSVQVHLSYQSRVGPIEWLRPYTDDVLPELGAMGVKNLVVVPISFVSEHIETLEEIDIEYKELAIESGISNWRRCPALNTDPDFIYDMADMVVDALREPIQTVTEACVANMVQVEDPLLDDETLQLAGVQGVGSATDLYDKSAVGIRTSSTSDDGDGVGAWFAAERWYARVAMAAAFTALVVELLNGKSLVHMFGG